MSHDKVESFFSNSFDDGTLLKLEIFSGYIREWLPVFLTRWRQFNGKMIQPQKVNLYDFFAGAGRDEHGNPGSALLLLNEIRQFCAAHGDIRAGAIQPSILFNDSNAKHIELLQKEVDAVRCQEKCCNIRFSVKKFQDALTDEIAAMRGKDVACLVIMDQFGVSEISAEVIAMLDTCSKTDFLFFITSSYISRFSEQKGIKERFNLKKCDYYSVHRAVCDYYKSLLPAGSTFHLAPFSIRKKNGNIYGIIFGSHHLYGLEKFLKVCWDMDSVTGEANYDIDNDGSIREGQRDLFENNTIKKIDRFEDELFDFIRQGKLLSGISGRKFPLPVTNLDIYRFTLEHGFLPKHATEILRRKNRGKEITVLDKRKKVIEKPRGFYLSHSDANNGEHRLFFLPRTQEIDEMKG